MKPVYLLLLLCWLTCSCRSLEGRRNDTARQQSGLSSRLTLQLGKSAFYLSLPPDYQIKEINGIDFTVYYFQPKDSTHTSMGKGGIYVGGHPGRRGAEGDNCIAGNRPGVMLNKLVSWDTYSCTSKAFMETIVAVDPYLKIHAFGEAKDKQELEKLLPVFSSLTQK